MRGKKGTDELVAHAKEAVARPATQSVATILAERRSILLSANLPTGWGNKNTLKTVAPHQLRYTNPK